MTQQPIQAQVHADIAVLTAQIDRVTVLMDKATAQQLPDLASTLGRLMTARRNALFTAEKADLAEERRQAKTEPDLPQPAYADVGRARAQADQLRATNAA